MNVVFDEFLNNIISYAYRDQNEHDIEIQVELVGNQLKTIIIDDGTSFNPFKTSSPDTKLSIEEREIGGLGIHLVQNMMDKVAYQRLKDKNVVTLIKQLDMK